MPGVVRRSHRRGLCRRRPRAGRQPGPSRPTRPTGKTRMFLRGRVTASIWSSGPLATDKVRHVGEPYAVVVAENRRRGGGRGRSGHGPAGPVEARWSTCFQAGAEDAPVINDGAPGNIVVECKRGPRDATLAAMEAADVVVEGEFFVPRTVCCQMEPRAGVAEYDAATGRYTLTHGNQGAHRHRDMVASALGVEREMVRVICPDVGGGFGSRSHAGPEYSVLAWAAKRLGRPVKWDRRGAPRRSSAIGRAGIWSSTAASACPMREKSRPTSSPCGATTAPIRCAMRRRRTCPGW